MQDRYAVLSNAGALARQLMHGLPSAKLSLSWNYMNQIIYWM